MLNIRRYFSVQPRHGTGITVLALVLLSMVLSLMVTLVKHRAVGSNLVVMGPALCAIYSALAAPKTPLRAAVAAVTVALAAYNLLFEEGFPSFSLISVPLGAAICVVLRAKSITATLNVNRS
jgi:hypothetical protein